MSIGKNWQLKLRRPSIVNRFHAIVKHCLNTRLIQKMIIIVCCPPQDQLQQQARELQRDRATAQEELVALRSLQLEHEAGREAVEHRRAHLRTTLQLMDAKLPEYEQRLSRLKKEVKKAGFEPEVKGVSLECVGMVGAAPTVLILTLKDECLPHEGQQCCHPPCSLAAANAWPSCVFSCSYSLPKKYTQCHPSSST